MPKVSVIMPSLNVGEYIKETIESVISQTLKDIEIICVDAGSTDGTLEILKEYASSDDRIRIILSDIKSYGYQMNLGIENAVGEYIGIVETDDFIEPDMYADLYRTAVENGADIVKSDSDLFINDENGVRLSALYELKKYNKLEYDRVYSCDRYLDGDAKPECYIWDAIYRRQFLIDGKVRFNETPGASFQDFAFRYQTCFFARRIVAVHKAYYHYRRDNTGSSTYNSRTAEFNQRESEFLLRVLHENGVKDKKVFMAAATEILDYAFGAFILVLEWGEPADTTFEAFEKYRKMFRRFYDKGYVTCDSVSSELYKCYLILLESTEALLTYLRVRAKIDKEKHQRYIDIIRSHKRIVIFGTGVHGNAVYIYLKSSRMGNIAAFCDNSWDKAGREKYGVPVLSPEKAVEKYPDALFITAAAKTEARDAMRDQLLSYGIMYENIIFHPMSTNPILVTNCAMGDFNQ